MVLYEFNQGVQKLKTKTKRVLSTVSVGIATLGLALAAVPAIASADTTGTNFESFSTGTVNGQQGWSSLGAAGSGCALYDHMIDSSLSTTGFGTKSLRISNAVVSGCFGDQTFSKSLTDEAGETDAVNNGQSGGTRQPHYEAQFDLASTVPNAQQEGLYMSVSPDRGDGARMSYLRFEDQSDGIHVIFTDATFVDDDIATLNRSVPHNIKFSMNFVNGASNDDVKIYIDGTLKHTGTSWEDYYRFDPESQGNPHDASLENKSRTVDSLLFRTGGTQNTPSVAGKGFLVDNFSETSGPVPVNQPTNKDQCKGNGWKDFGTTFKNQGDCVSFVATHGKNQPSGH